MNVRRVLIISMAVLLVAIIVLGVFIVQQVQRSAVTNPAGTTPTTASTTAIGMPHAQGDHLVDAAGHVFVLHGAQIETSFNYVDRWQKGERPGDMLNSRTFNAMAHDWKMNALRLPLSNWLYVKYTSEYTSQLDQAVRLANAAGIYVVMDLHDNDKAGSPYGKSATYPKVEDLDFWKAIATRYKDNPMVMFDVFNEPKTPNWQAWLHGVPGTKEIGFQDLVNGIRSVGAKQVIVVESGSAGGGKNTTEAGGWASIGSNTVNDPNIMYSLHVYQDVTSPPEKLDAKWGPILHHYPIYYGEWAFLPNAFGSSHCQNLPTDSVQANQVVANFLNYMASRGASWTAWQFAPRRLVQDYNSYAPTTLNTSFQCGNPNANVGMGQIVKQYLTTGKA